MNLIYLGGERLVNLDDVRSIEPISNDGQWKRCRVTYRDGTAESVRHSFDRLDQFTGTIVPAPPGYSMIRAYEPDEKGGEWSFDTFPVIAFRLGSDSPEPLTAYGHPSGDHWGLIWPDGRCDRQWDQLFLSVDDFKADYRPQTVKEAV